MLHIFENPYGAKKKFPEPYNLREYQKVNVIFPEVNAISPKLNVISPKINVFERILEEFKLEEEKLGP